MQNKEHNPIFVTGVERSGSSIVANILNICGAFIGRTTVMNENIYIKSIVDNFYKKIGADIHGQFPLPNTGEMLIPTNWKANINSQLITQEWDEKSPWLYKSSRLAQIWPVWNYAFPTARWVIVRRRTGDVISSCQKTAFMNAFEDPTVLQQLDLKDDRAGWLWWVHQHEQLFRQMIECGLNCKVIWPERILDGDYRQMYEVIDWLGLKYNPKIIEVLNSVLRKV